MSQEDIDKMEQRRLRQMQMQELRERSADRRKKHERETAEAWSEFGSSSLGRWIIGQVGYFFVWLIILGVVLGLCGYPFDSNRDSQGLAIFALLLSFLFQILRRVFMRKRRNGR